MMNSTSWRGRAARGLALVTLMVGVCAATPARAAEIYFNGVRVTGLRSQKFHGCTVRFDAKGNIHITAKGYTVKTVEQAGQGGSKAKKTTPKAALAHRYYLVSAGKQPKSAQYDVDVFANGKWIRKIRSSEGQVVIEIGKHLKKGRNLINFTATKNYGGKPRASTSAEHYLRVLVGIGTTGGGTVSISKTLADFRAPASKMANFGQAIAIQVD